MAEVIRAENIKRGFPMAGETYWALKGIHLAVEKGKLTILDVLGRVKLH